MNNLLLIYVTNPSKEHARTIAKHLLEKDVIACATIKEVDSLFWWEDALQEETEYVLVMKTISSLWPIVEKEITKMHEYETSCIIKMPVRANKDYEQWVNDEVIQGAD
jgi:periplasmic divalent cation tolerance protein